MTRPTRAVIDVQAFLSNYRHTKSLAPDTRAVAVVKANAYGHGAVPLSLALAHEADAFGVACTEEALELRASGIVNPIILLEGVFEPAELADVEQHRLIQVVHSHVQLKWVLTASPKRPYTIWLKLDSGMHRLGFDPEAFIDAYESLHACPHVGDIVLMTHFAQADETENNRTLEQLELFRRLAYGLNCPVSAANSPATLAWPAAYGDWIRPGIMLYGPSPLDRDHISARALRPVMRLESALIAVRELTAGESIGYGARYTCAQAMRVGVVAIGYGDGYPRHAIDGTPVAVKGVRSQIIGRVSMDMLTVDLTPVPDAKVGDPIELWGSRISVNDVARFSDTIAYELFTGVTRRVPLVYEGTP